MFVIPPQAPAAKRWLAHLVRAATGAIRAGDLFDDDLPFQAEAVAALARRHRVGPLLHRGLVEGRIADPVSLGFASACKRMYYGALRKNVLALEVGREVLAALSGAGVRAAPLKGWAIVEGEAPLYADPGLRPMDDLDLIVGRDDVDRAEACLRGLGFVAVGGHRAARLAGGHELAFHRRVGGVDLFVELHWAWAGTESLLRGFALGGERFLDELCVAGEAGRFTPSPLGHLLFTAVHAARHAFGRWLWLVDLHRLVERVPASGWLPVVAGAREYRVRRPLYAGLAAARELLRSSVPKEVLVALSPGPVRRRLLHRSLAASSQDPLRPRMPEDQRPARVAKLLLGESWWDVARTAAWAAAPGRSWFEDRGEAPSLGRRATHAARAVAPRGEGGQR